MVEHNSLLLCVAVWTECTRPVFNAVALRNFAMNCCAPIIRSSVRPRHLCQRPGVALQPSAVLRKGFLHLEKLFNKNQKVVEVDVCPGCERRYVCADRSGLAVPGVCEIEDDLNINAGFRR